MVKSNGLFYSHLMCLMLGFFLVFPAFGAEKPIKIGMIDCFTGGAAAFTKPALAGWNMVVQEFNAKAGF